MDPYQRGYASRMLKPPCTMHGSTVGIVVESKDKKFPKGARILSYAGWVKSGEGFFAHNDHMEQASNFGNLDF